MNSYPQEFITQLRPLMFVAGLEKFAAPAGSEETSEDDRVLGKQLLIDPFASLAKRLKDSLLEKSVKKGTIWMNGTDRAQPSFRIIFVDKEVRFPPQKTPNQEHSPLSPLTPTSPLHPDGLIAPIWIRKHSELLPSVFVLFLRLFEYTPSQSIPISPLHSHSFSEKELEARKLEEKKWDIELSTDIGSRKRICSDRGIKLTVVLMTSRKMLDDPNLDTRLTYIRRQSALDSRAALFVLSPVSPSELQEFVKSLQIALYEPSLEHYLNHSKKVRRKRNRYTSSYGTLPGQPSSSTPRSGSQALRTQGWIIRYEFKMGCFAEFRGEEEVARKHYQTAWEVLLEMFGSATMLPPRTKRWAEAKVLADCIAFKVIKLYLYRGEHTRAMAYFRLHLTRFVDFSSGWELGPDTWEFWGTLARWYRLIAELLEMGLAASLVLPDYTPPQEVTTSPSPYFQEFSLESHHIGTNPASVMQHPGYYYYAAAMFTQRRLERFTLASQSTKMPQSSLANERKVDHRIVMLELYTKAYEMFKKYTYSQSQSRFTFHIAVRIATIYHDSEKYDMAIKFLERVVKHYRKEQWDRILRPILQLWYICARETKDIRTMVALLIEMACYNTPIDTENISIDKQLETEPPPVSIMKLDLSPSLMLFPTTLAFYPSTVDISQPSSFQIHVRSESRIPRVLRTLSSLRVEFSGQMSWTITHKPSGGDKDLGTVRVESLGLIHMRNQHELFADLSLIEDGSLVLSGHVVFDVPTVLRASRIVYNVNSPWQFELVFSPMSPPRIDPLWLASSCSPAFIRLYKDVSLLTVRRKICQANLNISHTSPAYLDERYPITLTITNLDESDINVTLDILLQPTPDESINKIYLQDLSSSALIKGFACGTLRPAESIQKILYIHNMGSPGDRTLDISVQASPVTLVDGGASITQVNETLRTVVIPAIAPFDISSIPSYRPNNGTPLLPSNLASYISTQEHVCEALVKTVVTNSGPNSVIILGIDRVPEGNTDSTIHLASSSLEVDQSIFPLELCVDDSYAIYSHFKLYNDRDDEDDSHSHNIYRIRWSRNTSQTDIATTEVLLPTFSAQPDSVYAALELPETGVLHVPFTAVLRIHNRHPWKTLDAYFQLEASDHFVVSGLRAGSLPLLIGGSEERIPFSLIPISCGIVRLPTVKITQRKKGQPTEIKEEEVEKEYPVIDGRFEERYQDVKEVKPSLELNTMENIGSKGIFMSIFPA